MPSGSLDLRPGDLVEVRSAAEIATLLDEQGMTDGLPFMPEMLPHCGRRYQVFRRVEKTCVEGSPEGIKEFRGNDVVFLDSLRCPGTSHGGCGRSCLFFWKERWLRRVRSEDPPAAPVDQNQVSALAGRLVTVRDDGRYVCQSSELPGATVALSAWRRVGKCLRDVQVGTYTPARMARLIAAPLWSKLKERFVSRYPRTEQSQTPAESLNLQPGEWVQVKPIDEIKATLDSEARNRGLQFSYDLEPACGRVFRVRSRLEKLIIEGSGKMVKMKNTVILEGGMCPCQQVLGGCPRLDHIYWREIWLRRVPAPAGITSPGPVQR